MLHTWPCNEDAAATEAFIVLVTSNVWANTDG
jgi:hypothetical protein